MNSAELEYGELLRLPGQFLSSTWKKISTSDFLRNLHRHFQTIHAKPTSSHVSKKTFIHKELGDANFVFLREDSLHPALSCSYRNPYGVIDQNSQNIENQNWRTQCKSIRRSSQAPFHHRRRLEHECNTIQRCRTCFQTI